MLTPDQIRARAERRYVDYLRSICSGGPALFPLTVIGGGLRRPTDFAADRDAIALLRAESKEAKGVGYEIEWEERAFRKFGPQLVPATVRFATEEDFVGFLRKRSEVTLFRENLERIRKVLPELSDWIAARPLQVVAHGEDWRGLIAVVMYLKEHPRPNCYLRELPVAVDTKFIERKKTILSEILPVAAPQTVGLDETRFETRFGFRFDTPLVRIRLLDPRLAQDLGFIVTDFATNLEELRVLPLRETRAVIVENKMTFLTLPPIERCVAILGAGDAAAVLPAAEWLATCRVSYWGDLDGHGFEILANLRRAFPHLKSLLMDAETLQAHREFIVRAAPAIEVTGLALTADESVLYRQLVARQELLEQERIPNSYSDPRVISAATSGEAT
jgi:hypothetical protein